MICLLKKQVILLLAMIFSFTVVAAHHNVRHPVRTVTERTGFKPAGKPFKIVLSGTKSAPPSTIYARVEVQNIHGITYGVWYDEWHEGDATFVVKFYSNQACTSPYTLTASLDVNVYWHTETAYDYNEPDIYGDHFTYTASSGNNFVIIGNTLALYAYHYTYDGWNYHWTKVDHFYDVEASGDGSYYEEPTVGRTFIP